GVAVGDAAHARVAVNLGHEVVDDDELDRLLLEDGERLAPAVRAEDPMPLALEQHADRGDDLRLVVDHEDRAAARPHLSSPVHPSSTDAIVRLRCMIWTVLHSTKRCGFPGRSARSVPQGTCHARTDVTVRPPPRPLPISSATA